MAPDTLVVFGATDDTADDAVADYEAVKDFYVQNDLIDTYDAAVISQHADGKVKIVKNHEQPTRHGAWGGWESVWPEARWWRCSRRLGLVALCLPARGRRCVGRARRARRRRDEQKRFEGSGRVAR